MVNREAGVQIYSTTRRELVGTTPLKQKKLEWGTRQRVSGRQRGRVLPETSRDVAGNGFQRAWAQNLSSQSTPAMVLASTIFSDMTILRASESGKKRA